MKKIFESNSFFRVNTILAILMAVVYLAGSLITSTASLLPFTSILVVGICHIIIFKSYMNHTKNVMKAALGFMLGVMFLYNTYSLNLGINIGLDTSIGKLCFVFNIIIEALYVFIIINHFILNASHASNSKIVLANQIIAILITIASVVYTVAFATLYNGFANMSALQIIQTIAMFAFFVFTAFCVISIESCLDHFKAIREGKSEE